MTVFRVATFYDPEIDAPPAKCRIRAYTLWSSEAWRGCEIHEVNASNSAHAERRAIDLRLEMEREALKA